MLGHVPAPPITVGNSSAFKNQRARYYQALLHPIQEVRRRSKTLRLSATWACSESRPTSKKDEKSAEATPSAMRRADFVRQLAIEAGGPAGVIEPLARDGSLTPAVGGAEAMALKHSTQDTPVEKATRRVGVVPAMQSFRVRAGAHVVLAMPAPALLSLAPAAHCSFGSVRTLLPHDDCSGCLLCKPRVQNLFCTPPQALQTASQTAGRKPPMPPPKAVAQHRQSRVRFVYAPFAFRFRYVPPVLPHEMYGVGC